MRQARIKPISKKAKNRLVNLMGNNDLVNIEQQDGMMLFVASMNRAYFFWMNQSSDPNWSIEFL